MSRRLTAAGTAALLALSLGACSSAKTTTAPSGAERATATASTVTGTEVLHGQVTGKAAIAQNTVFPLTLTGPVDTTSTWTPPNNNQTRVTITFKTPKGNLAVAAYAPDAGSSSNGKLINAAQCRYQSVVHATYTVTGAKSTGSFAGATGHGTATVTFLADTPRKKNGTCDTSANTQPLAAGAVATFAASGPLTIKKM